MRKSQMLLLPLFFLWGVGLLSCATYQDRIRPPIKSFRYGNQEEALVAVEKLSKEAHSRDRLAYLMEHATFLQMSGRYRESSRVFIQADQLSEQLDYVSLSHGAASAVTGEETLPYKGDSYEKIMINGLNALNFLALNDIDGALVEIRRIDEKIKKYRRDNRQDYEFNPFASYLSGLLYEALKQWDDAYIAYVKTAQINTGSYHPFLLDDLHRVAQRADRLSHLEKEGYYNPKVLASVVGSLESGGPFGCKKKSPCGRLVVLFLQGWGPTKVPSSPGSPYPSLVPTFSVTRSLLFKVLPTGSKKEIPPTKEVSTPKGGSSSKEASSLKGGSTPREAFLAKGAPTKEIFSKESAAVTLSTYSFQTEPIYNVQKAAVETLKGDQGALIARHLGRVVTKEIVAHQIRQKDELLGALVWLAMFLSDRADLRQWASLPESIQMASINLPPGSWTLEFQGVDKHLQSSEVLQKQEVSLKNQETRFLILRAYR
jgi:uncharacterized protein